MLHKRTRERSGEIEPGDNKAVLGGVVDLLQQHGNVGRSQRRGEHDAYVAPPGAGNRLLHQHRDRLQRVAVDYHSVQRHRVGEQPASVVLALLQYVCHLGPLDVAVGTVEGGQRGVPVVAEDLRRVHAALQRPARLAGLHEPRDHVVHEVHVQPDDRGQVQRRGGDSRRRQGGGDAALLAGLVASGLQQGAVESALDGARLGHEELEEVKGQLELAREVADVQHPALPKADARRLHQPVRVARGDQRVLQARVPLRVLPEQLLHRAVHVVLLHAQRRRELRHCCAASARLHGILHVQLQLLQRQQLLSVQRRHQRDVALLADLQQQVDALGAAQARRRGLRLRPG
ncbi:uncharacterized protein BcabD6B2_13180 [Babesia caballi]|uniref:Uncharacterized protein n=1 Tax=Babesia caballi TaxID=5871 RepID=A0AAV4LPM7_BABCB|nr:hypothetical protein, conserved [Babesia caballi]